MYKKMRNDKIKKSYKKYDKKIKSQPKSRLPKVQLRSELKYTGASYSGLAADYTGVGLYLLNGIDQGTTETTRIGNNVKMKSINLKMTLSTDVTTTYYFYLVYDKQPNQAAMTINNFINAIGGNFLPYSQRNSQYKDRFVTLRSWFQDLSPNRSGATIQKTFEKYFNFSQGVPIIYTGSGSTVASISMGSIYLIVGSSSSTGPTWSGTHKLKYTDD